MNNNTKNVGSYKISDLTGALAALKALPFETQANSRFGANDLFTVRVWTATPEEQQEVRSALKPFSQ